MTPELTYAATGATHDAFLVWMTYVAQQSGLQEFAFFLGLIGGGLLVGAFVAIAERRSNR